MSYVTAMTEAFLAIGLRANQQLRRFFAGRCRGAAVDRVLAVLQGCRIDVTDREELRR